MISNIVFTKNRPLQLEGYLESLYRYFPSQLIRTYLFYKVDLFTPEYKKLFQKYSKCTVVCETDFYADFLNLIDQIDSEYILFGVDDIVYFDSVDLDIIDDTFKINSGDIFGFSLRFGNNILNNNTDTTTSQMIANQSVYRVHWPTGRTKNTCYPFELGATIYRTALVKKIIANTRKNNYFLEKLFTPSSAVIQVLKKVISTRSLLKFFGYFFNPNTLESWTCRWCKNNSHLLPGYIYFQKLCESAIQVNLVNTSTNNTFDGTTEHTIEALNEKYKQGYKLDIDFVAQKKPKDTHCGQKHLRLIRENFHGESNK